jgi:hypothetical protein
MSEHVKNIAIVGVSYISGGSHADADIVQAGGQVGRFVVKELLNAKQFNVTAITRADSSSTLPSGINKANVDYDDASSLVSALKGMDVLIITMAVTAPRDTSERLIRAAAEAKVPWVLPNEWGADHLDEKMSDESLVGGPIRAMRKLIEELGVSSWIACVCSFWYEYSLNGIPGFAPYCYGFDIDNKKVTFYNEGNTKMCTSTWDLCGKAVAKLLQLPIKASSGPSLSDYKNKCFYIRSFTLTQREMLDSILRVTGDKESDWTITKQDAKERYYQGLEMMKDPQNGRLGFGQALYARGFYPDEPAVYEHKGLANNVLGLEKEDLDFCTKRGLDRTAGEV